MRWLEVRRHSLTKKGADRGRGSHLSSPGVVLARRIGDDLGPVDRVVASDVPRAVETAIAMGYAVDETVSLPSGYVPGLIEHHEQWTWSRPYDEYAERLAVSADLRAAAARHLEVWRDVMRHVAPGGCGLVIGHGGGLELALVAAVGTRDTADWGQPLAHGDGFRLGYEDDRFVDAVIRRAPPPDTRAGRS